MEGHPSGLQSAPMPDKRYKSTCTKRKEEINELKAELRRLQSEMELQSLKEPVKEPQRPPLENVMLENAALSSAIHQQQLGIANVHSALSPPLESHPLCTRICLKRSWEERRAALLAIREEKFRAAYDYVSIRSQYVSSDQPQFTDERFETADGGVCCAIYQTVHFPGAKSLKQVYDAILFSLDNVEISISERLGHTTVRDDYDGVDGKINNARVVSTNDMDITTEVSGIMFSHFFAAGDGFGDAPCGMIVIDSVDEDELYPYVPSERVRKDVSAAFVLTARQLHVPRSTNCTADLPSTISSHDGEELVITLRRAAFVKLHYPQFDISEVAWLELQQDVARWGDVTTRAIRSVLYSVP